MYRIDMECYTKNGYSYTTILDNVREYCSASEYIKSLDTPLIPRKNEYFTIFVINDEGKVLSECYVG